MSRVDRSAHDELRRLDDATAPLPSRLAGPPEPDPLPGSERVLEPPQDATVAVVGDGDDQSRPAPS
jgi:hypothetical protein